jgi:hypothetical protein
MEQSPSWEANQSLQLVKKFPALLWNPTVHYRTHKCPPLSLSWANSIQTPPPLYIIIIIIIVIFVLFFNWPQALELPR